jgi:hypothetical protein
MFVTMECKNSIKKVGYGHFAECSRQRHPLPSAMATALGKARKQKPFLASFPALPRPWHSTKNFKKKINALPSDEMGHSAKIFYFFSKILWRVPA